MKKLAVVLLSILMIICSITGVIVVPAIGGNQPVGAVELTPQWVYESYYSGQPVSYWQYTVMGQETLPVNPNPGGSDGGICDKMEIRLYSNAACTVAMNPIRVASGYSATILSPSYDWRHVTDRQPRQRYSQVKVFGLTITNWLYYRLYTPSSFGSPYALNEGWTFTEQIDSSNNAGDKTTDNITVVIATATESVTVPAGDFTCYKLTITQGSKTIIEYWDASGVFPYAPIKILDSVSFDSTDTRVLSSYSYIPTPTPLPSSDYWCILYNIAGFQDSIRYSLNGGSTTNISYNKSSGVCGNCIVCFSKNVTDGQREVIIPAADFHLDNYSMGFLLFSTSLTSDAIGTLYVQDGIGDVDVFSESSVSTTPKQIDTIGDGTNDCAGSLIVHMPFEYRVAGYQFLYNPIFTTGHSYSHVTRPGKGINNSIMEGNGIPCSQYGGPDTYVGTPFTIITTGTGDVLDMSIPLFKVDSQLKMVFKLVPVNTIPNRAPVMTSSLIAPETAYETTVITATGTATDLDNDSLTYQYQWFVNGAGTGHADFMLDGVLFNKGDSVYCNIRAYDGEVFSNWMQSNTVTIQNTAPTAAIDSVQQPNPNFILPVVHTLTFNGSLTDPDPFDTHTAAWDFGDGTIISGPASGVLTIVQHAYSQPGDYIVALTVTDGDGASSLPVDITVTVVSADQSISTIEDVIQALPSSAFDNNPSQRINALLNKLDAVIDQLDSESYQSAVNKLLNDIRAKADGSMGGNPNNDWIIDSEAQQQICQMIDDLVAYIQTLI